MLKADQQELWAFSVEKTLIKGNVDIKIVKGWEYGSLANMRTYV